ncbi:TRAP transporter substrate-binding protein DctP [Henriciella sp. AS95]|uniref:TRAP transporter substrate-binding protein n=1 Tax=Henriciella sp. AS95 TaxID=3135782 RepID=UPI00317F56C1
MLSVDRRMFLMGAGGSFLAACSGEQSAGRLRACLAGGANPDANGVWIWMEACLNLLRQDGMDFLLSSNAALGREEDRSELVGLGLLHLNDAGISEVTAFSDIYLTAQLPFLFDDLAHFDRLISDPEFLHDVNEELGRAGLVLIDATFLGGMSGIFTTRQPVHSLEDMRRLRLRAMDRRDLVLIRAFGAEGVQVAWEETAQALQTGIADGYLNPPLAPVLFGHGTYLRYFTDLRIAPAHRLIVASARWLERLTSDERALLEKAFRAGHRANRVWTVERQANDLESLAAMGIEAIVPGAEDREQFKTRARAAYPEYAPAGLIKKAEALAGKVAE